MRVYISYRPGNRASATRVITRAMQTYGTKNVVFDPMKRLFPEDNPGPLIENLISGCKAVLILIGPEWSGIDEYGRYRLSEADRPVYFEVKHALASGRQVIPLLVDGVTALPPPDELPDEFSALYQTQPLILRDETFLEDLGRLIPQPPMVNVLRYWVDGSWLRLPQP